MLKINKKISLVLKIILVTLLMFLIYNQIIRKSDISQISKAFAKGLSEANAMYLLFCILLVPLNWFLEALKWKTLVVQFQPLSSKESMKAILSGLTIGIVTPQRIGEYGGRILSLKTENRIKGVLATFIGSLAQNIVNVCFGLIGVYYLNQHLHVVDQYWLILLVSSVVLVMTVLYLLYRNTSLVKSLVERFVRNDKWKKNIYNLKYVKSISISTHIRVFILAIFRYGVYVLQYVLILWFFGIEVSWSQGFTGVSSIYLIQTGIPLPPLLDIAARAELAYLVGLFYVLKMKPKESF